jgi:hypothetical protein
MDDDSSDPQDQIDALVTTSEKMMGQIAALKTVIHALLITHADPDRIQAVVTHAKERREAQLLSSLAGDAVIEGFEDVFRELL